MKRYRLSFAAACTHKPEHPERTARRNCGGDGSFDFDVEFQVWPSREAMLKTIDMQSRAVPNRKHWRAAKL